MVTTGVRRARSLRDRRSTESLAFPGYVAYCAAKGGLRMLCRDMALELAPYKINVVNVAPGAIATPINKRTLTDPDKVAALEKEIPLGRVGEPEEVARTRGLSSPRTTPLT